MKNDREGSVRTASQKHREVLQQMRCAGPTVPLIKMLTLGGGSSSSPVLLVPSLAADVTFHLSAHEPTPVSPAMVNGV